VVKLTLAQSAQINSAEYTINYEAEALASYEATGDDLMDQLEDRADCEILRETAFTRREDLGGLTVYFKGDQLVGFYDYERFVGSVF